MAFSISRCVANLSLSLSQWHSDLGNDPPVCVVNKSIGFEDGSEGFINFVMRVPWLCRGAQTQSVVVRHIYTCFLVLML